MRGRLLLAAGIAAVLAAPPAAAAANCGGTSVGLTPLSDLGRARYHGFAGGLYPHGQNKPPPAYLKAGLKAAARVEPLGPSGRPSRSGRIVLLSIGMSNVVIEFGALQRLVGADPTRNAHLVLVNGAQGGVDGDSLPKRSDAYFAHVEQQLRAAGVADAQVQAVWLKEAIAGEHEPFPADAQHLQRDLEAIIVLLQGRYPNLRLVYLASRIYAGYASSPLNPEPYAYDSGFAVKWTIADRLSHPGQRPWVAWGPYLWADGTHPRGDGLTWSCSDFGPDGTHPAAAGAGKVAHRLLSFLQHNATTRSWFNA